jgi:hypothetical protein
VLSRLERRHGSGQELKHERHRDQLLLGHGRPMLGKEVDERIPAQPRRAMHLRIATQQLVDGVLHVTAPNSVGLNRAAERRDRPAAAVLNTASISPRSRGAAHPHPSFRPLQLADGHRCSQQRVSLQRPTHHRWSSPREPPLRRGRHQKPYEDRILPPVARPSDSPRVSRDPATARQSVCLSFPAPHDSELSFATKERSGRQAVGSAEMATSQKC